MKKIILLFLCSSLFCFATSTSANPTGHGTSHHGSMSGHKAGHHKGGKHKGHYGPRNMAMKFLHMKEFLTLTPKQINKLKSMRDQFIDQYAASKQHLKSAKMDLRHMIHDDSVGMKAIEPQLKKIASLEGKLWRAHIKQFKSIQSLLTSEQKAKLQQKHRKSSHH